MPKRSHRGQRSRLESITRLPDWARHIIELFGQAPSSVLRDVLRSLRILCQVFEDRLEQAEAADKIA